MFQPGICSSVYYALFDTKDCSEPLHVQNAGRTAGGGRTPDRQPNKLELHVAQANTFSNEDQHNLLWRTLQSCSSYDVSGHHIVDVAYLQMHDFGDCTALVGKELVVGLMF